MHYTRGPEEQESGRTAVGDVADHSQQKEQIQLNIAESFLDLVSFQMLVFDSRLVASQPLNNNSLLTQRQPFSRDGTVRQEDEHDNPPNEAQSADNDELEFPARQRGFDVSNTEA
jgi:hypothetical protein